MVPRCGTRTSASSKTSVTCCSPGLIELCGNQTPVRRVQVQGAGQDPNKLLQLGSVRM